ncbi:MAG: flagellar export protein FliJ [Thermodesulfobacteriota bacterium]|nr:flagellar export protein FliJ [Thermodesulfobacteriota bacterium]
MKRFRFRQEAALKYRAHLEHLAKLEVAKAQADLARSEKQIVIYKQNYAESARHLAKRAQSGIGAYDYHMHAAYLLGIESHIQSETQNRQQLFNTLRKRQQELAQKMIDKKALEKLKERRKAEYYQMVRQTEQKELDDLTAIKQAGRMAG